MKLSLVLLLFSYGLSAQNTPVNSGSFPDSWDKNRDLRGENGQVLAWVHQKDERPFEVKNCILVVYGPDSAGRMEYYISQQYTNEIPFDKWHTGSIHYGPGQSGLHDLNSGYWDVHIEKFDHIPTEKELYDLFNKWKFSFYTEGWQTIEAGIDEKLWKELFGFVPGNDFKTK
jgi:hypothetical protein